MKKIWRMGAVICALLMAGCRASEPADSEETKAEKVTGVAFLTEEGFDYLERFCNGYAFAVRGKDCGYIDTEGNYTVYYQRPDTTAGAVHLDDQILFASRGSRSFSVSENGLFPWYDGTKNLWGYGDIETGDRVIEAAYEVAHPFSEGLALVEYRTEDGKVQREAIDESGQKKISFDYYGEYYYQNGTTLGCVEGVFGLYDTNGKVLFELRSQEANANDSGMFPHVWIPVEAERKHEEIIVLSEYYKMENGKWESTVYCLNSKGEALPLPEGAKQIRFSGDSQEGLYVNEYRVAGIIKTDGSVITEPMFLDSRESLKNGVFMAKEKEDGKFRLYGSDGKAIGEAVWKDASYEGDNGLIPVSDGEKWGYISRKDGALVIPCEYIVAGKFSQGAAVVGIRPNVYIINTKGEVLNENKWFDAMQHSYEGFFMVKDRNGWRPAYLTDKNGKAVYAAVKSVTE